MAEFNAAQELVQSTADFEADFERVYAIPKKDEHGNIIRA